MKKQQFTWLRFRFWACDWRISSRLIIPHIFMQIFVRWVSDRRTVVEIIFKQRYFENRFLKIGDKSLFINY